MADRFVSAHLARLLARRLTAAIRLEHAHQLIREHGRYGYTVTRQHLAALAEAEHAYDAATARLRP